MAGIREYHVARDWKTVVTVRGGRITEVVAFEGVLYIEIKRKKIGSFQKCPH